MSRVVSSIQIGETTPLARIVDRSHRQMFWQNNSKRSTEPSQCAKVSNCKVCKSDISDVIGRLDQDLDRTVIYIPQQF